METEEVKGGVVILQWGDVDRREKGRMQRNDGHQEEERGEESRKRRRRGRCASGRPASQTRREHHQSDPAATALHF